jgi:hypothetical protein
VGGGEGVGSLARLVEQTVDPVLALAVDERLEVPLDPLDLRIRDLCVRADGGSLRDAGWRRG